MGRATFVMTNVNTGVHIVASEPGYMKAIEQWLKKTGTSEGRLGLLAAANPRAVERIRNGSARIDTLNAVLSYIREHPAHRTKKRRSSTS